MLSSNQIEPVVRMALAEDAPWGDITSESLIPEGALATASLIAREPGVFSGGVSSRLPCDSRITASW